MRQPDSYASQQAQTPPLLLIGLLASRRAPVRSWRSRRGWNWTRRA